MRKMVLGLLCILLGVTFFSFFVFAQDRPDPIEQLKPKPIQPVRSMKGEKGPGKIKSNSGECNPDTDIMLNTDIPFVGRCIKKTADAGSGETNSGNVFQKMMAALTKIVMAVVVIIGFLAILVGGFMISAGGVKSDLMSKGKDLIIKVIAGLALVGISGIILNLINPNFFKTGGAAGLIVIQTLLK